MYTDLKRKKPKENIELLIGVDKNPMFPKLSIYKNGKFWDYNDTEIELFPTHWKYYNQ